MELKSRVIRGEHDGPHLLILGGVHGDEFEAMAAIRRLARQVEPGALRGRLTLIPVVNESAFRNGTRTGEDGLDLARVCPGQADGSVTERAAHAVSEHIRRADYLIDLHSGGLVMEMGPLVGYTLHADADIGETQHRMALAFGIPLVWATSATLDGRTLSVARDHQVPAIYAEWLGGGACDPRGVEAYAEGCLNVMGALNMIDRTPPTDIDRVIFKDPRPGSGHVQASHPAGFDGFFEPEVELGQTVEQGQVLGRVTDALGDRVEVITSQQKGIVVCLRVFSRVLEGDSVAAILETLA